MVRAPSTRLGAVFAAAPPTDTFLARSPQVFLFVRCGEGGRSPWQRGAETRSWRPPCLMRRTLQLQASQTRQCDAISKMAPELIWEKMFCPRQGRVEDVPVYFWRYTKGIGEYFRMLDALKWREIDLSPFLVAAAKGVKIPVTPLVNPVTGWSSYFIIRMIDDEDETYKVDCLIRDSDLYFMGFRRWMMLKGWSRWYRFKEPDMRLPAMFNAIDIPVVAGYEGRWRQSNAHYVQGIFPLPGRHHLNRGLAASVLLLHGNSSRIKTPTVGEL